MPSYILDSEYDTWVMDSFVGWWDDFGEELAGRIFQQSQRWWRVLVVLTRILDRLRPFADYIWDVSNWIYRVVQSWNLCESYFGPKPAKTILPDRYLDEKSQIYPLSWLNLGSGRILRSQIRVGQYCQVFSPRPPAIWGFIAAEEILQMHWTWDQTTIEI